LRLSEVSNSIWLFLILVLIGVIIWGWAFDFAR
jgi:hypothetical protein